MNKRINRIKKFSQTRVDRSLSASIVLMAIIIASVAFSSTHANAAASTSPFLAGIGCAMAHCDQSISGLANTNAPTAPVTALWHDTSVVGSSSGLGCASNTQVVACSFINGILRQTTLKVYSASGSVVWSSSLLNSSAYASAPLVEPSGAVIAADNSKVVSYNPNGKLAWQTATPGGTPISPNITNNGAVILATSGGPVSAYDAQSGALLNTLMLNSTVTLSNGQTASGYYDTVNTPAVNGNRIYISTQFHNSATNKILPYGRLYAIDFNRNTDGTGQFSVAWTYDFEAPSGGSPTVTVSNGTPTIYFDGSGITPGATTTAPQLFAVNDLGTQPQLEWKYPLAVDPQAAATQDPRGGVWTFSTYSSNLVRLDQSSGSVLQTINVNSLVNPSGSLPGVYLPSSAMTITGTAQNPVMIVSATPLFMQQSYIIAINLNTSQLLWSYRVDQSKGLFGVSFGQYPIVLNANNQPEVVFSTDANGVWALASQ
jgi:hypothetical protein